MPAIDPTKLKRCGHCRHWAEIDYYASTGEDDKLGECNWHRNDLPFSMRYAGRERVCVAPADGYDCPQWSPKV